MCVCVCVDVCVIFVVLITWCIVDVGHITGRHDSHRSLTACPLYHNMSAEECKACGFCLLSVKFFTFT